jgi:class 3 adenylate cyclase
MRTRRTVVVLLSALVCTLAPTVVRASATPAPPIVLNGGAGGTEVNGKADVLDDPGGNLDIDDVVRSRQFRRVSDDNQPPPGTVRWYRFRISTPDASRARWYLMGDRACVSLDLYEPRSEGGYSHVAFGYGVPFAGRDAPGRDPATLVHIVSAPLYARVRSEKYPQYVNIVTAEALRDFDGYVYGPGYPASVAMLVLAIVVAGLGTITRSRSYWLLAAVGLAAAATFALPSELPRWLPHLSPPPVWTVVTATFSLYFLAQAFFYDRFLALDRLNAWLRLGFFGLTALVLVVNVALWLFSTSAPSDARESWFFRLETLWFLAIGVVALAKALRGDRAAWFVLPGALLFAATTPGYLFLLGGFEQDTALIWQAFVVAVPFNMLMLIFGVGDRVRQAAVENQRLLQQRDTVQHELIDEQGRHITDVERRNVIFSRFMPREFLAQLEKADLEDVRLGDHIERKMAVVFADIRGFTPLAERLPSEAVFQLLNAYLARAGPIVRKHGGFIDKYIGDGILALFPDGPAAALDAAIALQSEVRRFNDERSRQGHEPISIGIGINYGDILMGTIGEAERYETTVIADTVNVASRLQDLTKVFGVSIIAGCTVIESLADPDAYCLRPLGHVAVRGHEKPADVFEVFDGDSYEAILRKRHSLAAFRLAVVEFEAQDYAHSAQAFEAIAANDAHDTAAVYFRDRSRSLTEREQV